LDEIDISPILLEDLREDASGSMIKEMSDITPFESLHGTTIWKRPGYILD
jgi:hypothetical protein